MKLSMKSLAALLMMLNGAVMASENVKNPPNTKKNFGYLMWRKRNCVFL